MSTYSFRNKNKVIKESIHFLITKPLLKKCFIHTTSNNEYVAVQKVIKAKGFFNIPNFIKLNKNKKYLENQSEKYFKLIFLSRIEEKKGLDILINALKNIKIPYRLSIAGDGESKYIELLKTIASENGVGPYINWLGFQANDKFDIMREHDLLVLPSYDENFGNVIIESLSVGTGVLIGENVGLRDYITENKFGWLCSTNALSVTSAINSISNQPVELLRIRNEAPAKILKDFDENSILKKYIDMYNQIVKK